MASAKCFLNVCPYDLPIFEAQWTCCAYFYEDVKLASILAFIWYYYFGKFHYDTQLYALYT